MTLKFESGALVIRDGSNALKFSSDENLFTITNFVDSRVVGQGLFPQRSQGATATAAAYTNETNNYFIANVNPAANIVFGMAQFVPSSGGTDSTTNGSLWQQANGTIVYTWWSTGEQASGIGRTDRRFASALGLATFFITNGQLLLRQRLVLRAWAGPSTAVVPEFTVNFRLYCGTFI